MPHFGALILGDNVLPHSNEVKYLGVVLDQWLNWISHLDRSVGMAISTSWSCLMLFGKTWGLDPKIVVWNYYIVVTSTVTHAFFVWR